MKGTNEKSITLQPCDKRYNKVSEKRIIVLKRMFVRKMKFFRNFIYLERLPFRLKEVCLWFHFFCRKDGSTILCKEQIKTSYPRKINIAKRSCLKIRQLSYCRQINESQSKFSFYAHRKYKRPTKLRSVKLIKV